jgi:CTP synthase
VFEWVHNNNKVKRTEQSDKGGTMRLGSYPCQIQKGSLINEIYGTLEIFERHRHRYEVNTKYMDKFREKGFIYSGMSPDNFLPEIMESKNHNWFIGVQFHPELKSRPQKPHPLFISFIKNCIRKEK